MATTIRLMRFGKKKFPIYRIVVLDKRKKRDGAYLDQIGVYNPNPDPFKLEIDQKKFDYWVKNGAQISTALRKLFQSKSKNKLHRTEAKKD
ncbi:MAG: 30S ribosomal protein S16 [Microgenomates group bacterium]|nr:30S ribosomal protein S16 [Microgenomates group bacterium]